MEYAAKAPVSTLVDSELVPILLPSLRLMTGTDEPP